MASPTSDDLNAASSDLDFSDLIPGAGSNVPAAAPELASALPDHEAWWAFVIGFIRGGWRRWWPSG